MCIEDEGSAPRILEIFETGTAYRTRLSGFHMEMPSDQRDFGSTPRLPATPELTPKMQPATVPSESSTSRGRCTALGIDRDI
ncbi:hypothetical protein IMZ48_43355 [Candidatus Bathyarchaeota archaeon]|nr:hypothetical protein [Candidatus Bathyarchaeota archaeon]